MPGPSEAIALARKLHQSGSFQQAEQLYRQFLQAEPAAVEVWQMLGDAQRRQGKPAEASASYRQALSLRPASANAYCQLASVQAEANDRASAVESYRQALRLHPTHADALIGLGTTLAELGKLDEAVSHLRLAADARPESAKAHHNLGVALAQQGKARDAEECLRAALRIKPDYVEACYNLGNVLKEQGKRDEAIASFREGLRLKADHADIMNNLGLALNEAGRPAEAAVLLQQAVRLRPAMAEAHNNLGLAYADLGRFAEAEASYRESLKINPAYTEAHNNLASTWKEQGRLEEALAGYEQAIRLQPDSASSHWNRSLALLASGDYARGWSEYEWRWKRKQTPPRPLPQPMWDGTPLQERTILLWMEQGLGDMLQFIRYAPLVQERGGTVIVECPAILVGLFSRCRGIDRVVAEGSPLPAFDCHAPLLGLPRLLQTTLTTVPADIPYLFADAQRTAAWGEKLRSLDGFKVGIVWQGNPHNQWDRWRSIPLEAFAPLAAIAGVRLITLQKGPGVEQLESLAGRFAITTLADDLDAEGEAFADTAAIMKQLDLVITVDTATAHLAGGLGVPVWMALATITDWRWLTRREESPWYPTLRIFRQSTLGDWPGVFDPITTALREKAARAAKNIRVDIGPGELIDRITILQLKAERLTDSAKRAATQAELAELLRARDGNVAATAELDRLTLALQAINQQLWRIEDEIRVCERRADFGPQFIALARQVCKRNDERTCLKGKINELLGCNRREEKVYSAGP
jgi:tetratricopeptide (TPR) repeat protein